MPESASTVWLSFAICVSVIGIAGVKLTVYGDAIADKTGMGGSWVGLILIATVTSLPELASGLTAVTVAGLPDIAVGDVLGSCVYNLVILAVMDSFLRKGTVLSRARPTHVLTAGFGIILIGVSAIGLAATAVLGPDAAWAQGVPGLHIGWTTPLLIAVYALAVRTLYHFQTREVAELTEAEADRFPDLGLRTIGIRYGVAAAFVVAAGIWLPFVSEDISVIMGWEQSFTGTLFTALSTSLPELVVTLACVRIGAIDLGVGNVLGSNLFNLVILAIDDLFYLEGPILAAVSPAHLISTTMAMTMTGVVIVGLFFGSRRRLLGLGGWESLLLYALFALNSWLAFAAGGH
jgi:cation:H+ antiporter